MQRLPAPTVQDRERAYEQLLASLRETARLELAADLSPQDLRLVDEPILVETLDVR